MDITCLWCKCLYTLVALTLNSSLKVTIHYVNTSSVNSIKPGNFNSTFLIPYSKVIHSLFYYQLLLLPIATVNFVSILNYVVCYRNTRRHRYHQTFVEEIKSGDG